MMVGGAGGFVEEAVWNLVALLVPVMLLGAVLLWRLRREPDPIEARHRAIRALDQLQEEAGVPPVQSSAVTHLEVVDTGAAPTGPRRRRDRSFVMEVPPVRLARGDQASPSAT
jgi:hypothetical protein